MGWVGTGGVETATALIAQTHGVPEDGLGGGVADAIDVLQRELDVLLVWDFHAANTGRLNLQRSPPRGNLHSPGNASCLDGGRRPKSLERLQALRVGDNEATILSIRLRCEEQCASQHHSKSFLGKNTTEHCIDIFATHLFAANGQLRKLHSEHLRHRKL
jgi:hypothetical protein